jgi:SAM-dependent methyltransferase
MSTSPAIGYYEERAAELAAAYEGVRAEAVNAWLTELLPAAPGMVIDVGAGSGRDAAWFASRSWKTVAVEPSQGMRAEGQRRHADLPIQWEADELPGLRQVTQLGYAADLVIANGVWMHVPPSERGRALRKLMGLAKSGGLVALTFRRGGDETGRGFHPTSMEEIRQIARSLGLWVVKEFRAEDASKRAGVEWECVALRLPDDGTNALPLLRRVILNDDKNTTYKFALLRAITLSAEVVSGFADLEDPDYVLVPMGVIAVNWLRLYLPLLQAGLPQSLLNVQGGDRLGFVQENGARALVNGFLPQMLHIGARIADPVTAQAVRMAVRHTVATIAKNPAEFIRLPDGSRLFQAQEVAPDFRGERGKPLVIDDDFVNAFGILKCPANVWSALQRYAHWIEPSLKAAWIDEMRRFRTLQRKPMFDMEAASAAMAWADPERGTDEVRRRVEDAMRESAVLCVWTGDRLTARNFDVDHCFPWSAWPCNDLWNLLPSRRDINQHKKGDKLPSFDALDSAGPRIVRWWRQAYWLEGQEAGWKERFQLEAHASLAALSGFRHPEPEQVFGAMHRHRLRLWQDQRVTEWDGPR